MKKSLRLTKLLKFSIFIICCSFCLINIFSVKTTNVSFASTQTSVGSSAKTNLDELNQKLYSYLSEKVQEVASGTTASTSFKIESSTLTSWGAKTNWTAAELGKSEITSAEVRTLFSTQFSTSNILTALLHDHPYDLYWFNKTGGMNFLIATSSTSTYVNVTSYTVLFDVAIEYRPASYNAESPTIDIAKTTTPKAALAEAKQIVEDYKSLNDYQKLNAYKTKICELVSYNDEAAENDSTPYGNPWQLVYVFDNNPDTNVVCEGYAKAFQLLCNLSSFNSPYIKCYTISGSLGGGHMWNIVTMDDEQNYIVDITNCDTGTIGQNGELFLAGTNNGNIASGYSFYISKPITYSYNTATKNLWGTSAESILNINIKNYEGNFPTITVSNDDNIIYDNNPIGAGLIGTENVDINFSFNSTDWLDNDYTWTYVWFSDNNNHIGTQLSSTPINAGKYWIKITATNKVDPLIKYTHSKRIEIKPKEILITSVVGLNKTYDGTQDIAISNATLNGVLGEDKVDVDYIITQAQISGKNVGTYNSVNVSNVKLTGDHKDNYYISSTNNIPSNEISVTPAKPTCSETYAEITQEGTMLSDLTITINGSGVLDENVEGIFIWTDSEGNEIDPKTTEIIKDATYYYIFTPTDSNYESVLVEVKLWETKKSPIKNFFTDENIPTIIKYSAVVIGGVIVIALIALICRKPKNKSDY